MERFKSFSEFTKSTEPKLYLENNNLIIESLDDTMVFEGFSQEFFNSLFAWNEVTTHEESTTRGGFMGMGAKTQNVNTKTHTELGLSPVGATVLTGLLLTVLGGIVGYKYIKDKQALKKKMQAESDVKRKEDLLKELEAIEQKEKEEVAQAMKDAEKAKETYDKKVENMPEEKKATFIQKQAAKGKKLGDAASSALNKIKNLFK